MASVGEVTGWLHKLGGGKSEGFQWRRRFFALRGKVLTYHTTAAEATGPRMAPRGIVHLGRCVVALRQETAAADGSIRYELSLSHAGGDTLVLAASTEAERERWVCALRQVAVPLQQPGEAPSDGTAAAPAAVDDEELAQLEDAVRESERAIVALEAQVEAARRECAQAARGRERVQTELGEATAALHLRKSLLHWRERTLSRYFGALVAAEAAARGAV